MCTDWDVYKNILFHLLQNAIKFSHVGNKILIIIEFCRHGQESSDQSPIYEDLLSSPPILAPPSPPSQPSRQRVLNNILVTRIVNFGQQFDEQKLKNRQFKTFAFQRAGTNQIHQRQQETEGIGIGLSTANALIRALGGGARSKCEKQGQLYRTAIWFTSMMTKMCYADSYSQDLQNLIQIKRERR